MMLRRHAIFAGSKTQAVISLLSAAVRGPCRLLELAALTLDFGFGVQAEVRTDSTAAEGLGRYDPSSFLVATSNRTTEH